MKRVVVRRERSPEVGDRLVDEARPVLGLAEVVPGSGTDGLAGLQELAGNATLLYYMSEEAQEGRDAFQQKRRPDFARFPRRP